MPSGKSFIDRAEELMTLEKEYAKATASLVIVYGRRRVGKTALINEFLPVTKDAIYTFSRRRKRKSRTGRFSVTRWQT